jgi:hypothetical protein
MKSEKYKGSIHAGVDQIKQKLKTFEAKDKDGNVQEKAKLYIFDTEENQPLITAMRLLERDRYRDEGAKGVKDEINEGRWDAHAALRYAHQVPLNFVDVHIQKHEFHSESYE